MKCLRGETKYHKQNLRGGMLSLYAHQSLSLVKIPVVELFVKYSDQPVCLPHSDASLEFQQVFLTASTHLKWPISYFCNLIEWPASVSPLFPVSDIVSLSLKGMGIIEQLDPTSFTNYLKKYRNTICGRHPIGVLLNVSAITQQPDHHCCTRHVHPIRTPKQLVCFSSRRAFKTRRRVPSSLPQQMMMMMMMTVSHKRDV